MRAMPLMLLAVLLYSLIPLLVDMSGTWESVALITGTWTVGYAVIRLVVVSIIGAQAHHRKHQANDATSNHARLSVLRGGSTWTAYCLRSVPHAAFLVAFVASFQWVFFAWSARHVEVAITTVIFEFWPVLFLLARRLVLPVASKRSDYGARKRLISSSDMTIAVVAGAGLAMTILSEGGAQPLENSTPQPYVGILLAGIAVLLNAMGTVAEVTVGETSERILRKRLSGISTVRFKPSEVQAKLAISNVSTGVARLAAGVLLILWGVVETGLGYTSFGWGSVAFGAGLGVFHGITSSVFFAANHASRSDTINTLCFAVPVLALTWLWLFTEVTIAHTAMFLVGVVVIVAANAVLYLKSARHTTV